MFRKALTGGVSGKAVTDGPAIKSDHATGSLNRRLPPRNRRYAGA
jgi:hypothetical protein